MNMFGRRRPLARAAIVGGVAYHVGKSNAQKQQAQQDQAEADQQAENEQTSAGSKGGQSNANFDELTKLQKLHENGVLTDEEFADAKKKVIAGM
jgi:hypothetical protein